MSDLEAAGVEVFAVRGSDPTGVIAVLAGPDGERTMATMRGASVGLQAVDLSSEWFAGVHLLHLPAYSLFREPLAHAALHRYLRRRDARPPQLLAVAAQLVPGRSWAAWSRALGLLMPPLTVADLGCGEGYLTMEAARWASRVIAVDKSEVVLGRAKALARRRRVSNVVWKKGELEKLPMSDGAVDVAMLSQALHHAHDPSRAVAEAARVTSPGGRVLLLDLRTHEEDWVRSKLGDRRLGFGDDELRAMLTEADLSEVKVGVGARKAGDPFTVLIAAGTKGAAKATKTRKREHPR